VVVVPAGPISLVPNAATEDFTLDVLGNVYESLVDLDPTLRLGPGLADSWYTLEDGTWVFRLRPGVRWHDGRPLVAQDVADSLNRTRAEHESDLGPELGSIQGVTAPDPSTVLIKAAPSFEALPLRLANVFISRQDAGGAPVGTGPYTLASSGPDLFKLEAFPDYDRGLPAVKTALFRVVPAVDDGLAMAERGSADLVVDVRPDDVVRMRGRLNIRSLGGLRVFFLVLSCRDEAGNPFRDPRVRRAVAAAIDRASLVRRMAGYAQAVRRIASREELGGNTPDLPTPALDLGRAREWLKQAGYPRGFEVDLDTAEKYVGLSGVLPELERQLGTLGILVRPKPHPSEAFVDLVKSQRSRMYLMGWLSDVGDSRVSYEDLLHSRTGGLGVYNGGAYADPEADRLIETAARTASVEGLDVLLDELDEKLAADVPVVPLFRQDDLYAVSPRLDWSPRLDRRVRIREARLR
jgi:peptide/nickel transport system substrate-binding protein